jgi:ribonuclease P protein component
MLASKNRLAKKLDIKKVFDNKKSIFGNNIIINFIPTKNPNPRFAFSISSKYFKKSVERNYYKRILRSIIREILPNISKNFDFVVVIKSNIKNSKYQEIKQECINLFNKIK